MNSALLEYIESLPRNDAAADVLRALCHVLRDFGDGDQLHSLAYEAGRTMARQRPLRECEHLQDFATAADASFRAAGWGTLEAQVEADAVAFRHGASPLKAWFGDAHGPWCHGFFEGVLSQWLRELGAGEQLEVRHAPDATQESLLPEQHYRFAHRARLRASRGAVSS